MKKLLLISIAALLLATGTDAVAAEFKMFEWQKVESGKIHPAHFILIKGLINKGDDAAFKPEAFSNIRLHKKVFVGLESDGGAVIDALNIGTTIRKMGWDTIVLKTCASACALIWLAGHTRWVSPKAAIGFHAIYYGEGNISSEGNALVGAYLRDLGLSLKAIRYVTQAPPDEMEWLTAGTAFKYDIKIQVSKEGLEQYE